MRFASRTEGKESEVNALTAESDKLKADIMKLSQQIVDLTDAIAEIDASVAKATEVGRRVERSRGYLERTPRTRI